jgi:YegS/Rv2252/BmrU family lipid kinase
MRKALVLYNPASGNQQAQRKAAVESVLEVLRAAGLEVRASQTGSSAEATAQARAAVTEGSDVIFACGGDGTVHDILQGMAGSQVPLAIIPLGTANALAHDLGVPRQPDKAARAALAGEPLRAALGQIECRGLDGSTVSRYFIVAAGIGADAYLFYRLAPEVKRRLGMTAYVYKSLQVWLTHAKPWFEVEVGGTTRRASQVLAVRIRDFGNVLRELAPGADLRNDILRLVMFHTRSRWLYLLYVIRGLLGLKYRVGGIELHSGDRVSCHLPEDEAREIYVEADGELIGTLPAEIRIVPDALTLLVPRLQL